MSVKWTPDMAAQALESWAKKEISDTTDRFETLFKFYFGVSASSIVAFIAVYKLYKGENASIEPFFIISIIFYLSSILIIMSTSLRNRNTLNSNSDLHDEFSTDFKFLKFRTWIWFFLWVIAFFFSGVSIYL